MRLFTHYGDLADPVAPDVKLIYEIQPDEIYHLGAQSHVRVSLRHPRVHVRHHRRRARCGCSRRSARRGSRPRFYQASSSEMFGVDAAAAVRDDRRSTRAAPTRSRRLVALLDRRSTTARPTGCTCVNGILFNHESPRRGETFVTRKITRALARIKARAAGQALPRQPRRQARLGLRARLRASAMWRDAPDRRARRLRDRDGREALRARVPRRCAFELRSASTGSRTSRSTRATSARPRSTRSRRRVQGARSELGWEPRVALRGAGPDHGRRRRRSCSRTSSRARGGALQPRGRPSERRRRRRLLGRHARSSSPAAPASSAGRRSSCSSDLGAEVRVLRSAEHDLRDRDACREAVDGRRGRDPPRRQGRRHRLQPPQPGAARLRQPADGRRTSSSSRAGDEVAQARRRLLGLRLSEAHPGAVPRGRHLGRLPGGVQRSLRAREEDADRALRRLPAPVRLRLLRPGDRQPLRARTTTSTSRTRT